MGHQTTFGALKNADNLNKKKTFGNNKPKSKDINLDLLDLKMGGVEILLSISKKNEKCFVSIAHR